MTFEALVADPKPIEIRHDARPERLQGLLSLRATSRVFKNDLDFSRVSELKATFYGDKTIIFTAFQRLIDLTDKVRPSVRDSIHKVIVGEYDHRRSPADRRQDILSALRALHCFQSLDYVQIKVGPFDWRGVYNVRNWLENSNSREVCHLLLNAALNRYDHTLGNRPVLDVILKSRAMVECGRAYTGDHGDIKVSYRESAADARDWARVGEPVELARSWTGSLRPLPRR